MMIQSEQDILNVEFRLAVIKEINGDENIERKKKQFKKYEIYKDKIKKYLQQAFEKEGLKDATIAMMMNRATNISVVRKIVNKLSRTYNAGVIRTAQSDEITKQIDDYADLLDINKKMKKSDRYRELYKNGMIQIVPEKNMDTNQHEICTRILSPWQYDIVEDPKEREEARILILSEYDSVGSSVVGATEEEARTHSHTINTSMTNGKDDIIADSPLDASKGKKKNYIWWSKTYHFTTDSKGEIIPALSPDDLLNPIGEETFINVAEDQDGYFWADGGDDLVDGGLLLNQLMTDMNSIAYIQGYGQFVITGRNLPARLTMGPHHALMFDYDVAANEPKPEVTVVNANPPLDAWMKSIEQYCALLLSTNSLSPATISMKLDAGNFPSGIAMLIEMSEANNDIADTQKKYISIEKKMWNVIRLWHNLYYSKNLLNDESKEIGEIPELELKIKFVESKPVVSEKEKLEAIKQRQELGLNTQVELLQIDDPALKLEDAETKVANIQKEKSEKVKQSMDQGQVQKKEVDGKQSELPV